MTREAISEPQAALLRRGLALEYATLGWNVVGAAYAAITARQTPHETAR